MRREVGIVEAVGVADDGHLREDSVAGRIDFLGACAVDVGVDDHYREVGLRKRHVRVVGRVVVVFVVRVHGDG